MQTEQINSFSWFVYDREQPPKIMVLKKDYELLNYSTHLHNCIIIFNRCKPCEVTYNRLTTFLHYVELNQELELFYPYTHLQNLLQVKKWILFFIKQNQLQPEMEQNTKKINLLFSKINNLQL